MNYIPRIGMISTARANFLACIRPSTFMSFPIYGIASREEKRAQEYAKQYGIQNDYKSYDHLLADPKIDCVYISLPNALHADYILKALAHDKHVICEKPFVLTRNEQEKINEALQHKKHLSCLEGIHYCYYPPVRHVIDFLKKQQHDIVRIETYLGFPLPADPNDIRLSHDLGGGAFHHFGCYGSHLVMSIFDEVKDHVPFVFSIQQERYRDVNSYAHIEYTVGLASVVQTVSLKSDRISSFLKVKFKNAETLVFDDFFTPTTFYDRSHPGHSVFKITCNHKDYFPPPCFDDTKTTYEYQWQFFMANLYQKNKQPALLNDLFLSIAEIIQ